MGQKIHPYGLRLGIVKDWESRWYAEKDFADFLIEDYEIRKFLKERLYSAGISKIEIERTSNRVYIIIYTAKPGLVIGRGGSGIEEIRKQVEAMIKRPVNIKVNEIRVAEGDAQLIAENVAGQLERRIGFRRAMKQAIQRAMRAPGVKGCKIMCSGRLGGAEIARNEMFHEGSIPLHTLRADIQYGFAEAKTTYGRIGVKVWIYRGEILPKEKNKPVTKEGGK
ncbi:MAG: 30S ribosomal protein S3 [Firmicutes bacterium]|jgi:small subunit ribosomal protein S3|nr:30S ribosomal protein S3 [Bacillota bacterium]